ncbi:YitT family protein [Rhodoferax sp.]|uniref:YitT family protein n=1 Tax=Rhodoferax sp. TaxID=50421 RepID=UPI002848BDBA|nr:YitT family protein [Rhodoferax sp.]MDR3367660.1 YitT family protein [Rhodoferax sp.]
MSINSPCLAAGPAVVHAHEAANALQPSSAVAQAASPGVLRHHPFEDVQALLTGTLFVALGVVMFSHVGLLTGGTAGLALLIHYATGWNFGAVLVLVNVPFYVLAWRRMGRVFTLKTMLAVALLAVMANLLPKLISFAALSTLFTAVMGGLLMGVGILMLFRHRASLGGFNVLALYLQDRFGWRAGKVQMAMDASIVLASFAVVDWQHVAMSVLGAVVLNQILATNHRKERYVAL